MSWLVWLLIPVAATLLVACWTWLRGRPKATPTTRQAVRAHQQYLDALDPATRADARADAGAHGESGPS